MTPLLHILYRISDGGYAKQKLPWATKAHCLDNFLNVFGHENLHVFADNCNDETLQMLKNKNVNIHLSNKGSSAQSWRMVAQYALQQFDLNDNVYFVEDDYLHWHNANNILLEGLAIADYITLYDHPDKYLPLQKGGNPLVKNNGENTKVIITASTHWKHTNSTTMTFACSLQTLKNDWDIWDKYTRGTHPHDFKIFTRLTSHGSISNTIFGKSRTLISPLPAYSTHIEMAWLAPLRNWEVMK
ncbi:MAG: hypothetical protein NW207_02545 [Cytophagales bacterium]|nr:hypothetical protein [Cytophagales bacterium]